MGRPASVVPVGTRFGLMVTIGKPTIVQGIKSYSQVEVICDVCNKTSYKKVLNLNRPNTKGCTRACCKTHGMSGTKLYKIWDNMITRTTRPSHKSYETYKDRRPPDSWFTFEGFYADMGTSYVDGFSIERVQNRLPYSKENCIWIPLNEQCHNRASSIKNRFSEDELSEIAEMAIRTDMSANDLSLATGLGINNCSNIKTHGVITC